MQTLSELLEVWQPQVDDLARSEGVDRLSRTLDPRRLILAEIERASDVEGLLRTYSKSLVFPENSSVDGEVLYIVWTRIQEGCYYGRHLDGCGFGEHQKHASDWILFLTIDSWREVIRYKWHVSFSKHHDI